MENLTPAQLAHQAGNAISFKLGLTGGNVTAEFGDESPITQIVTGDGVTLATVSVEPAEAGQYDMTRTR